MLDGEQCLRDAPAVEGIEEPEGGQGGSRCNKMLRDDLPEKYF